MGCQLITIFITQSEYNELLINADRIQTMSVNQDNSNINNGNNGKTNGINAYPIPFKKKIMKRDKSIVFTNIPEECNESGPSTSNNKTNVNNLKNNENNALPFTPQPVTVRPNHLPLRFKNITSRDIPESGFSSSITFDEHDSFPQFIGRTSVCSTPMTENKVLHGNILPICANLFNENSIMPKANNSQQETGQNESPPESNVVFNKQSSTVQIQKPIKSINTVPTAIDEIIPKSNKFDEIPNHFLHSMAYPLTRQVRRNSLIDISETFRKFSRHLSMRPISVGFSNFMHECDYVADGRIYFNDNCTNDTNQFNNSDYDADTIDDVVDKKRYRTITDPTYPVFNSFGQPISRFLFEEILSVDKQDDFISKNSINYFEMKQFASHDSELESNDLKNTIDTTDSTNIEETVSAKFEKPPLPISDNNIKRKSLSLPLKSLTNNNTKNESRAMPIDSTNETNIKNIFDKAEDRRKLSGIQLTPLITKLSILAMSEERSSGFSSWDTTPGIELATPLDGAKLFRRRSSIKAEDAESIQSFDENRSKASDNNDLVKVELFICGQNNMTMLLIIREDFGQKQENIQAMVN